MKIEIETKRFMSNKEYRKAHKPNWCVTAITFSGREIKVEIPRYPAHTPAKLRVDVDDADLPSLKHLVLHAGPTPPAGVREVFDYRTMPSRYLAAKPPLVGDWLMRKDVRIDLKEPEAVKPAEPPVPEYKPTPEPAPAVVDPTVGIPDEVLDDLTRPDPVTHRPDPVPAEAPVSIVSVTHAAGSNPITWVRDRRFEATLASFGLTYRTDGEYPLSRVDLGTSQRNSARPGMPEGLSREKVEQIVRHVAGGGIIEWQPLFVVERPAFLATDPGKESILGGGNHRANALVQAGHDRVAAYVIDGRYLGDRLFRQLAVAHTMDEGTGLSDEDRITHAMGEAEANGFPTHLGYQSELARRWGLNSKTLARKLGGRMAKRRLQIRLATGDLRVPGASDLPTNLISELIPLSAAHAGSTKELVAGLVTVRPYPTCAVVRTLVASLTKMDSDASRSEAIATSLVDLRTRAAAGRTAERARNTGKYLGEAVDALVAKIESCLPAGGDVKDLIRNPADRSDLAVKLSSAQTKILETIRRLA